MFRDLKHSRTVFIYELLFYLDIFYYKPKTVFSNSNRANTDRRTIRIRTHCLNMILRRRQSFLGWGLWTFARAHLLIETFSLITRSLLFLLSCKLFVYDWWYFIERTFSPCTDTHYNLFVYEKYSRKRF